MTFSMKTALFTLLMTVALSAFSQASGTIQTSHVTVQTMLRSTIDNKWVYIDATPRTPVASVWKFDIGKDGIGAASMVNLSDGESFSFVIKATEVKQLEEGDNVAFFESTEIATGDKCTLIVSRISDIQFVSVMMPDKEMALFFDNATTLNPNQF